MAHARFVHVGLHYNGPVPIQKLEETFNKARDWFRYDTHCWVLYTSVDLNTWRERLRTIDELKSGGFFFLCEFAPKSGSGYAGFMGQDFWDWLQKDRSI